MPKKKLTSDHMLMISRNGKEKAVPGWQIEDWKNRGIFEEVGYKFKDSQAEEDYEAWLAAERRRRVLKKSQTTPIKRDEGIAGAAFNIQPGAKEPFSSVPPVEPGKEKVAGEEPLKEPEDVI